MALLNLWVGVRLPILLQETGLRHLDDLERKVAAYPHKDRVSIVVVGNSHALAGLRPEIVAEQLGLEPGAAFSLALPGAGARETRLLLERYLPAFPGVKWVVCMVDGYFLTSDQELRLRYLSRRSDRLRWHYAMTRPDLEQRLGLIVGRYFPIVDFSSPLQEAFKARTMSSVSRLVRDWPAPARKRIVQERAHPYPWGIAPAWDLMTPSELENHRKLSFEAWDLLRRSRMFLGEVGEKGPAALAELTAIRAGLVQRGQDLVLVEAPLHRRMHGMIQQAVPREHRAYRAALDAYVGHSGVRYVSGPGDWQDRLFYDGDHLTPEGARRLVGLLGRHLTL